VSITRLQQARQMYALGQRVAKTMDGSRPGYRGREDAESQYGGGYSNTGQSLGGNNNSGNARENYISKQYTNVPTPTVTVGVDKFDRPINVKTTYTAKRARQKTLDALNKKGISSFDPRVTKLGINPFDPKSFTTSLAPTTPKGFNWKSALVNLGLYALNPPLAAKYNKAKSLYNAAKYGSKLATDLGLTKTDVVESITSNFTDNFSNFGKGNNTGTKSTNTNTDQKNGGKGDGEGIASLENQTAGYDEYILLLQKLQTGNITEAERNRFNVLKNMLGI
jgi:hypothetical protein